MKRVAREEQEHWESVTDVLQLALPGYLALLGVAGPMAVVGASVSAAFWLGARKKVRSARGIADDPPRMDFDQATYLRTQRFHPEAFGTSVLAQRAARAIEAVLRASDSDDAFVRAVEKLDGARERAALDYLGIRREEVERFGLRSAEARGRIAETVPSAADALRDFHTAAGQLLRVAAPPELDQSIAVGPRPLSDVLPDSAIGLLVRAGFERSDLAEPVTTYRLAPENFGSAEYEPLIAAAAASAALAEEFRRLLRNEEGPSAGRS